MSHRRDIALLDRLGDQHGELLALARSIRARALTGDVSAARRSMDHLLDDLDGHTRTEEVALFPTLSESGMAETAERLERDHRGIDDLADEAARAADAHWPSIALDLLALLAAHIRREEDDVFPAAAHRVPPACWDQADDRAARIRS